MIFEATGAKGFQGMRILDRNATASRIAVALIAIEQGDGCRGRTRCRAWTCERATAFAARDSAVHTTRNFRNGDARLPNRPGVFRQAWEKPGERSNRVATLVSPVAPSLRLRVKKSQRNVRANNRRRMCRQHVNGPCLLQIGVGAFGLWAF